MRLLQVLYVFDIGCENLLKPCEHSEASCLLDLEKSQQVLAGLDGFEALGLTACLRSRRLVLDQSDGPGLVVKVPIALSLPTFQHSLVGISASQRPQQQDLRRTNDG